MPAYSTRTGYSHRHMTLLALLKLCFGPSSPEQRKLACKFRPTRIRLTIKYKRGTVTTPIQEAVINPHSTFENGSNSSRSYTRLNGSSISKSSIILRCVASEEWECRNGACSLEGDTGTGISLIELRAEEGWSLEGLKRGGEDIGRVSVDWYALCKGRGYCFITWRSSAFHNFWKLLGGNPIERIQLRADLVTWMDYETSDYRKKLSNVHGLLVCKTERRLTLFVHPGED